MSQFPSTTDRDERLDAAFQSLRDRRWTGAETCPRIEELLMSETKRRSVSLSRPALVGIVLASLLGGGAIAAGITGVIQRVTFVTDSGERHDLDVVSDTVDPVTGNRVMQTADGATLIMAPSDPNHVCGETCELHHPAAGAQPMMFTPAGGAPIQFQPAQPK